MVTHSNIPAWRIPRTEEPGGLQPRGVPELLTTEQLSTHKHSAQMRAGKTCFTFERCQKAELFETSPPS